MENWAKVMTKGLSIRARIPPSYDISEELLRLVQKEIRVDTKETLKMLSAISHPTRLSILKALKISDLCVCVFVSLLKQKYSKLSYHLKLLKDAGLVDSKKNKNFLLYRLTDKGAKILRAIGS